MNRLLILTLVMTTTLNASMPREDSHWDYSDKLSHVASDGAPVDTETDESPFVLAAALDRLTDTVNTHSINTHTDPIEALKEVVQLANMYYADKPTTMIPPAAPSEDVLTPWSPVPLVPHTPPQASIEASLTHAPTTSPSTGVLASKDELGAKCIFRELDRRFQPENPPFPPSPCHTPLIAPTESAFSESSPRRTASPLSRIRLPGHTML